MSRRTKEGMTCDDAVKSFNAAMSVIRGAADQVLNLPSPDTVEDGIVNRCGSCRRGKNSRACSGWSISLRRGSEISFEAPVGNRRVIVLVEGSQVWDFSKAIPGFPAIPVEGSYSVSILDENSSLITRQHSDVANFAQAGSVGHLQLGGLPSMGSRPDYEWLDVPRWPMMPVDLVLLVELLIYSFFPLYWLQNSETVAWRRAVQGSETQMYSPWRARMELYWNQRESRDSWLKEQCNINSSWRS